MPSFLENYTTVNNARAIPFLKKGYFAQHLKKFTANEYVPTEYNDDVKCVLVALHMSGLGRIGDELQHVSNATKALANGFDPKNLPLLYKNEIQKLSSDEKLDISGQCQNTPHSVSIFNFLFPEFSDTVANEYPATVGDGSIAADVGSAESTEHGVVEISGNVPFGLD